MILSAIAAMSQNRVIGVHNKLPWHLPEDLKYFKEKTKGKILIMGRKTYDSIGSKPLPGRFHIIITRQKEMVSSYEQVKFCNSLEEAIRIAEQNIPKYSGEVFVVGGSEIYLQSLKYLNRLYLTVIQKDYNGDAFFPEFLQHGFKLSSEEIKTSPEFKYSFQVFSKK